MNEARFGFRFMLVCLVLLLAVPAFSQTQTTGAITARATDASGALIPGVEVTISSPAMIGGSRTAVTDEQGAYRFTELVPGVYRVSFGLAGFKNLNIEEPLPTLSDASKDIPRWKLAPARLIIWNRNQAQRRTTLSNHL